MSKMQGNINSNLSSSDSKDAQARHHCGQLQVHCWKMDEKLRKFLIKISKANNLLRYKLDEAMEMTWRIVWSRVKMPNKTKFGRKVLKLPICQDLLLEWCNQHCMQEDAQKEMAEENNSHEEVCRWTTKGDTRLILSLEMLGGWRELHLPYQKPSKDESTLANAIWCSKEKKKQNQ